MEPPNKKQNNTDHIIYIHTDPYFKTRNGLYIMADCLLSLLRKDLSKCTFYDTHTMISTFDSNINKDIYVMFDNITNKYLLENNNTLENNNISPINYVNDYDDAVAGLYDD